MSSQVFLLNSPVLTAYGDYSFTGPLTDEESRRELANGFVSAIGHAGAAEFLSQRLGIVVPMNRVAIEMQPGDRSVVLRLLARLPENRSLTNEETSTFPSELAMLIRTR